MFYIITIIIVIAGGILHFNRKGKFDNCKPKILKKFLEWIFETELNEYLVNIMIAFLGVTAAIAFTNFNTAREEKIQTIDYLETVLLTELSTKGAFVTEAMIEMNPSSYFQVIIEGEGITEDNTSVEIEQKFKPEDMFETMKIYPISPVLSLDILLTNSPYMHTISRYSYSALISCRSNFNLQKTRIENATSIEEMEKYLKYMADDFYFARKIVEIELEYQNGKISEEDVYNQIDKLFDELRGNEDAIVIG